MTTPAPRAGWYPDPSGKPGQMYWDGQRWQEALPPPPHPPTSWDQARPQLDKRRRFWSGASRERKIILALAGLLVVVAVIAVPVAAFNYLFGGDTPSGTSQSYQVGYDWGHGNTGVDGWKEAGMNVDAGVDGMCQTGFTARNFGHGDLDESEFMQGCRAGFSSNTKP